MFDALQEQPYSSDDALDRCHPLGALESVRQCAALVNAQNTRAREFLETRR
ncbi:MAG: hypothetical protein P8R42_05670 [Candidatus Binatia bacterium]|nr:hypothetical protein [Candidatus Binatia bacterium]